MRNKFLLFFSCVLFSCSSGTKTGEAKNTKDSTFFFPEKFSFEKYSYRAYFAQNCRVELRNERPSKSDTAVKLCIPAAFTRGDNGGIDGLFIINGKIINRGANRTLYGGLLISGDSVSIIPTNYGKFLLTKEWTDSVAAKKCSFFQQIQLVRNRAGLPMKDKLYFQRRAVVVIDRQVAIVESDDAMTMGEFVVDLGKLFPDDAIYTDMGSFDEGWYRDEKTGEIITLGQNRSQTDKQSNWLVFVKK